MAIGLIIRDGGNVARTATVMIVRDGTNTPRTVTSAYIRDANNVSRLFYNPSGSATIVVSATPTSVYKLTFGTGTATTNSTTATASLGTAPYTYAWTLLSYDGPVAPTAGSPAAATTTFTQTGMAAGGVYTSDWRVTATDANSNTATADIVASFADGA